MWVDSQCHVSPVWYEPVETLLDQMKRQDVAQAVLVQMLGQTDNDYQQRCLERFPGRFASVVIVDPSDINWVAHLNTLADEGATGLRLRPTARSPGDDPLSIWRHAEERGLAISCVGNSANFASNEFAQLVEALPKLKIVLEHLGGTSQPDADDATRALQSRAMQLAKFPNVYLKVPGLGELMPRRSLPFVEDSSFAETCPRCLVDALEAFGVQRLMWGSDFPPVSSREGYANALRLCMNAFGNLAAADRDAIFGGVARQVFKL